MGKRQHIATENPSRRRHSRLLYQSRWIHSKASEGNQMVLPKMPIRLPTIRSEYSVCLNNSTIPQTVSHLPHRFLSITLAFATKSWIQPIICGWCHIRAVNYVKNHWNHSMVCARIIAWYFVIPAHVHRALKRLPLRAIAKSPIYVPFVVFNSRGNAEIRWVQFWKIGDILLTGFDFMLN